MQRRIPAHFVDVIDKAAHAVAGKIERVGNLFVSVEPCLNRQRPLFGSFIPTRHAVDVEFGNATHGRSRIQKTCADRVLDDDAMFLEIGLPLIVGVVHSLPVGLRIHIPIGLFERLLKPVAGSTFGGFFFKCLNVGFFWVSGTSPKDNGRRLLVYIGFVFAAFNRIARGGNGKIKSASELQMVVRIFMRRIRLGTIGMNGDDIVLTLLRLLSG